CGEVAEADAAQARAELYGVQAFGERRRVRHLPARVRVERVADGRAAPRECVEHVDRCRVAERGLVRVVVYELEARLVDGLLVEHGGLCELERVPLRLLVEGAFGERELRDAEVSLVNSEVIVARDERVVLVDGVVNARAEAEATKGRKHSRVEGDG